MNGYLLTLSGTMDDMPVGLFEHLDGVTEFIKANPPEGVDVPGGPKSVALRNAADVAPCGPCAAGVLGYNVTRFVNGAPVKTVQLWGDDGDSLPTREMFAE